MSKRARGPILVPDDAVVMRASEVIEFVNGRNLREAAAELGMDHSTLHRFLRSQGYTAATHWTKSREAQEARA